MLWRIKGREMRPEELLKAKMIGNMAKKKEGVLPLEEEDPKEEVIMDPPYPQEVVSVVKSDLKSLVD